MYILLQQQPIYKGMIQMIYLKEQQDIIQQFQLILSTMALRVRLVSAQLTHDTELLTNMDPYCMLRLGAQNYRSRTRESAGKKPVWNETFQFNSLENNLRVTVYDKDMINDDLIGQGVLNVSKYRGNSIEQSQIVQLYYHGKAAGKVQLIISGSNIGQQYPQYNQTSPQKYQMNQQWGGYNVPPPQVNPQFNPNSNWAPNNNTPWGDLQQNNGWGNFNPTQDPYPTIAPINQNVNPLHLMGAIFNQQSPPPPPQNTQIPYQFINGMGFLNSPQNNPYSTNPYSNNPYR